MSRRPISQKLRFEIFKRDEFTCQYCGRKPPLVVLHCDHIEPVISGGLNSWDNLVTACADCNLGKRDFVLPPTKIMEFREKYGEPEYMLQLMEACAILLSRIEHYYPAKVFPLMRNAVEFGCKPQEIIRLVSEVQIWEEFETVLSDFVSDGVPIREPEMTMQ